MLFISSAGTTDDRHWKIGMGCQCHIFEPFVCTPKIPGSAVAPLAPLSACVYDTDVDGNGEMVSYLGDNCSSNCDIFSISFFIEYMLLGIHIIIMPTYLHPYLLITITCHNYIGPLANNAQDVIGLNMYSQLFIFIISECVVHTHTHARTHTHTHTHLCNQWILIKIMRQNI